MPVFDLDWLPGGLSTTWAGYLRDWDRSMRSANHPETTRYNYVLAATYSPATSASTPTSSALVAQTLARRAAEFPNGRWRARTRVGCAGC